MRKLGDRVGAILRADSETISLIGYGRYVGHEIPPEHIGGFNLGLPNPKLEMDDGTIVWGCECWWGSEAAIMGSIGNRRIIHVDMNEVRNANLH